MAAANRRVLTTIALAALSASGDLVPPIPGLLTDPTERPPRLPGERECCVCERTRDRHCACIPRGTSIVFVGDSITRYQYTDLAYSLKHGSNGSWAHRARNHPLIYHSWELTPAERAQTSAKLTYARALHMFGTSAELSPEEECDCHPADGMSKNRGNHLIDNHYYHEPRCGLNLTYFSTRGHWKVEGHRRGEYGSEPPGVAFRSILGRLGQSWELRWRWVLPPAECIERIVAPLHAHALVFNDGLWRALGAQAVDLRAVRNASAHAAPCVVWKTTTKPRAAERAPPDAEGREAFARDVIFEAGRMTERLAPTAADYVDKMHFRPEIYNALNVEMLRGLFGAPERPPGVPRTVGSWRCPKPGTHFPSPER